MNSVPYLSGWNPNLYIQLHTSDNNRADFNRLLVKGFPPTEQLQHCDKFENANRQELILKIKSHFVELMEEGASHQSLYCLFLACSKYLRWCDNEDKTAFTQASLEGYMQSVYLRVMRGEIKRGTYKSTHCSLLVLFRDYLDLPYSYFANVAVIDNSDQESFEAYTRSDLNQLLPFLRSFFKQTYQQFIQNPDKHINAHKNKHTMTFHWKGRDYNLGSGVTKMMCAATFLLSYYTYANSNDLFQLKQPTNASTTLGEKWYTMPAFKRRAFKTIQVEIGNHDLDIPKYAMSFFDNLLHASRIISTDKNAHLLQTVINKKVKVIHGRLLQSFLGKWVETLFVFKDQSGRRLRPVISRFRETGAQLTTYHQGDIVNNIMLNNTTNTRKKSYSQGNRISNNGMIQDAMSIREEQIKSGTNTIQAQTNLGIKVLVIEEENRINLPDLSRTANGTSCAEPFGEKSKKYMRKAVKHQLARQGEHLACADLLNCFGCQHQVIVQSATDIWCLLSFKACIEESLYLHLDALHYRKNFESIVTFIETKILPNLNTRLLKQAEAKLDDVLHPLWSDTSSVLELIPQSSIEVQR